MKRICVLSILSFFLLGSFSVFGQRRKTLQSDTSKIEWMKVYFDAASDHSFATPGNLSNDKWDMIQPLVNRIDSAKFSIDIALYDFQNFRVGKALTRAARRGVRVRVVTENENRVRDPRFSKQMWDTLGAAGIYSIDDAGTVYGPKQLVKPLDIPLPNAGALMHDKFAVFDKLSPSPDDDYVWTGSMNITYTGNWNTNVTFVIKDNGIAEAYTEEFEQMWGGKDAQPNPSSALFHKSKHNVYQNFFYVDKIPVEVYFGPLDAKKTKPSISQRITTLISDSARSDIHFLAFAISPTIPLSQAMIQRNIRDSVSIEGVIDPSFYARYRNLNQMWAQKGMRTENRLVLPGKEVRKLHAKTIIIDALYPNKNDGHQAIVIAGSYNFSAAAEKMNDENILMIHNNRIANQFLQDFKGVQSRALRKTYHRHPDIKADSCYSNFRVSSIGHGLEVELDTNFYYPVTLLAVEMPKMWAGTKDSTYFYAEKANKYLRELVDDGTCVTLKGSDNHAPRHIDKIGAFSAYINMSTENNETIALNHQLIATGNAMYSRYGFQDEDSTTLFIKLQYEAQKDKLGMWAQEDSIGRKVPTIEHQLMEETFPLDINEATKTQLMLIPRVGPAIAGSILDYRAKIKKFRSLDQLLNIHGIGEKTLERLKKYLVIGSTED